MRALWCQFDGVFYENNDLIFTTDLKPNEKLPIIFYIHGGGFVQGAGNEYEPDFLIEKDVILVIRLKLCICFKFVN